MPMVETEKPTDCHLKRELMQTTQGHLAKLLHLCLILGLITLATTTGALGVGFDDKYPALVRRNQVSSNGIVPLPIQAESFRFALPRVQQIKSNAGDEVVLHGRSDTAPIFWPEPRPHERLSDRSSAVVSSFVPVPGIFIGNIVFLVALSVCYLYALKRVIRPPGYIAAPVEGFQSDRLDVSRPESGVRQFATAARAFNGMRSTLMHHIEERIQMLSAFSHDMQTPITRMRLRAELADDFPDKEKFLRDLDETERLMRQGIAYAKSAHLSEEEPKLIDIKSFIESLALDYRDTGRAVSVISDVPGTLVTRPYALRRALSNLIDNSLKFSNAAEICVTYISENLLRISVMDRGPGIPEEMLDVVRKPFVRANYKSSPHISGAGLGLAIVQNLAATLGASFDLRNRPGGGLVAELAVERTCSSARRNSISERA